MKQLYLVILVFPFIFNAQIFTENFESGVFPPEGWTVNETNTAQSWSSTTNDALEGIFGAEVNYDSNVAQNEDLISPSFDFSNVNSATLYFRTKSSYFWGVSPNDNYDIKAYISIDGGTNWTEIWNENELAIAEGGTFINDQEYLVVENLNDFLGSAPSDVKLKFNYTGLDGDRWIIDDIRILECADVTGLSIGVNGITSNSIDLDWNDSHDTYSLEYGPTGFTLGTGTLIEDIAESNYQITDLTEATAYDIYVSGNCDATVSASDQLLNTFTSIDSPTNLDYSINFDAPGPLYSKGWSTYNGGEGNDWLLVENEDEAQSPTNFLAYNWNTNFAANAWAFSRGLNLTAGVPVQISFYYKVESADYPEKLKATIGNANTVDAQTEVLWDNNGAANLTNEEYAQAIINYTPDLSGIYYVGLNCYSDSNMFILYVDSFEVVGTTSVEDVNDTSNKSILYPNPVSTYFNIKLAEKFDAEKTTLLISDMNGKQVFKSAYTENINVSSLEKGVYVVTILDDSFKENHKLIIQ